MLKGDGFMMQFDDIPRGRCAAAIGLASLAATALAFAMVLALALAPTTALAQADLAAGSADLAVQAQPAGGDAAAKAADAKAPALEAQATKAPSVAYRTHVQTYGWQRYVKDGATAGTTGKSKRLEGMNVKLVSKPVSGSILYRTHIQRLGWEKSWKKDGQMSGTQGRSLRLEAMQVKLTGDMAKKYDVYYRVHAQHFGWMGWAKNGQSAGTAGYSYRLEAMQIKIVKKGAKAPGSTANRFRQAPANSFTIPAGTYSYVAPQGGYRGSMQVKSDGTAVMKSASAFNPQVYTTNYKFTRAGSTARNGSPLYKMTPTSGGYSMDAYYDASSKTVVVSDTMRFVRVQ